MIILYNHNLLTEAIDFKSFQIKHELTPDIFHENSKMKEEVRKSLLEMASNFFDFLQFDWLQEDEKYVDVWLVGSLASYNWSPVYSDIDVHLIIDYKKITENIDLLENDLWALKTLYNDQHKLHIKNYDVELYLQDINEDIKSNGIFSILKQTWIKKPEKLTNVNFNKRKVQQYVKGIENQVEEAIKLFRLANYDEARNLAQDVQDQVMELRKVGLAEGGEFSDKNIAFKALRRNDTVKKLERLNILSFDKEVSIEPSNAEKFEKEPEQFNNKRAAQVEPEKNSKKNDQVEDEDEDGYTDGIAYSIQGRKFGSLRDAEKVLNIPKSTIEYRVNSETGKWGSYKKLT